MKTIIVLFWISLFVIFYTFIGYGILLYFLVKIKEALYGKTIKIIPDNESLPSITLFIAAYNEEKIIENKLKNSLCLDYPADKYTILFITDGSDDSTVRILENRITTLKREEAENFKNRTKGIMHPTVLTEHREKRGGKAAAFNRGMEFVKTDIVIFTDANTMLNRGALREIVSEFSNDKVGCVAGEKRVDGDVAEGEGAVATEGIYWKYESFLKSLDSRLYSTIGAAGELFAIRTSLFEKLDESTILDDFMLSMRIASKGYKIAYCSKAYAVEGTSINMSEEAKRKVRISAGGLQAVFRLLPLLNIFKYPVFSFQYISHRVLRWLITPFLLIAMLVLNILAVMYGAGNFYFAMLICQGVFYFIGAMGFILSRAIKIKTKIPYIIYYFLFMNFNVFAGIVYLIKGKNRGIWEKTLRAE